MCSSTLPRAEGLPSTTSGQFEVSLQSYVGYTQFTVSYNTSRTFTVGSDLTLDATVAVDNLTGAENYVRDYVLVAVLLCDDTSVNQTIGSSVPTQRYLYAGALWGPLDFSIPLTQADTGLSPGQEANASLTLHLITDVSYEDITYRESGYGPVTGQGGTFVQLVDPPAAGSTPSPSGGQGPLLLASLVVAAVAALLVLRFAVFRKRKDENVLVFRPGATK